jgi:hypothetical protein
VPGCLWRSRMGNSRMPMLGSDIPNKIQTIPARKSPERGASGFAGSNASPHPPIAPNARFLAVGPGRPCGGAEDALTKRETQRLRPPDSYSSSSGGADALQGAALSNRTIASPTKVMRTLSPGCTMPVSLKDTRTSAGRMTKVRPLTTQLSGV